MSKHVIGCVVLSLIWIHASILASEENKNLLVNGDFASGLPPWHASSWFAEGNNGLATLETVSDGENKSLLLKCSGNRGICVQKLEAIEPGGIYKVTGEFKSEDLDGARVGVTIDCKNADGKSLLSKKICSETNMNWTPFSGYFKVPEKTASSYIYLLTTGSSWGKAWFKSLTLIKATQEEYAGNTAGSTIKNMQVNGGFEYCANQGVPDYWYVCLLTPMNEWTDSAALKWTLDSKSSFQGKNCLEVSCSKDLPKIHVGSTVIRIPQNGYYTISAYLKSDKPGAKIDFCGEIISLSREWTRYVLKPRKLKEDDSIEIGFTTLQKGNYWIDAVQMEPGKTEGQYVNIEPVKEPVSPAGNTDVSLAIPEIECVKTANPPIVDGDLNDSCWKDAAPLQNFTLISGEKRPSANTEAFVCCDDENIYLGIRCLGVGEPAAVADKVGSPFKNDCIEIFIDPQQNLSYHHLALDLYGNRAYNKIPRLSDSEMVKNEKEWKTAVKDLKSIWTAEIAIPFDMLDILPGERVMGLNVCRSMPSIKECSSWSCTLSGFHSPVRFGRLKVNVISKGDGIYFQDIACCFKNGKLAGYLKVGNPGKEEKAFMLVLDLKTPSGKKIEKRMPVKIPAGSIKDMEYAYFIENSGEYSLKVTALDDSSKKAIAELPEFRYDVEAPFSLSLKASDVTGNKLDAMLHLNPEFPDDDRRNLVFSIGNKGQILSRGKLEKITCDSEIPVDISNIPCGEYVLTVGVAGQDKMLFPASRTFFKKEKLVERNIEIDSSNNLIIDGRAVLPMFFYQVPRDRLRQFSADGFKIAIPASGEYRKSYGEIDIERLIAYLDEAQRCGVDVFLSMGCVYFKEWHQVLPKLDESRISALVAAVKDHPALIGWYIADELMQLKMDVRKIEKVYQLIKEQSSKPVILVEYASNQVSMTVNATDVVMVDPYPITRNPIGKVAIETEAAGRYINHKKPIWTILQAFGGGEIWSREPVPKEEVCMVYMAIIHGAKGLGWFMYKPMSSDLYNSIKTLSKEINELTPILLEGKSPDSSSAKCARDQINFIEKDYDGYKYLIAVNISSKTFNGEFSIPRVANASRIEVLFEKRSLSLDGEKLFDRFSGYQRHVYRIRKN